MDWVVEYTDEFEEWWDELSEEEQDSIATVVRVLQVRDPDLPHPYSSGVKASRHGHMRELRIQHRSDPYRVPYAFDPRRTAILLLGGNKTGDDRWYDEHLQSLSKEGSPDG